MPHVIDFPRVKVTRNLEYSIFREAFEAASVKLGYASAPELEFVACTIMSEIQGGERNRKKLCDHALILLGERAYKRPEWASAETWEQLFPFRPSSTL